MAKKSKKKKVVKKAKPPKPPRAKTSHCGEDAPLGVEQKTLPPAVADKPVEAKSPAEWAYERLILYIQSFEEQLDNEHEIAMGFTGGDAGILRIEGVGFYDPDIVTFYGRDQNDTKTQLIQHVSQLNVMLRALPRNNPDKAPARIGFRLAQDLQSPKAT